MRRLCHTLLVTCAALCGCASAAVSDTGSGEAHAVTDGAGGGLETVLVSVDSIRGIEDLIFVPIETLNESFDSEDGWQIVGDPQWIHLSPDESSPDNQYLTITSPSQPGAITAVRFDIDHDLGMDYRARFRVEGGLLSATAEDLNRAGVVARWFDAVGSLIDEEHVLILDGQFESWRTQRWEMDPPEGAERVEMLIGVQCVSAEAPPITLHVDEMRVFLKSIAREHQRLEFSDWEGPFPDYPRLPRISSFLYFMLTWDVRLWCDAVFDEEAIHLRVNVDERDGWQKTAQIRVTAVLDGDQTTWHPDLIHSTPVGPEELTSPTISAVRGQDLPLSVLPVAAVSSSTETVGLVIPPGALVTPQFTASLVEASPEGVTQTHLTATFPLALLPGQEEQIDLWLHRGPSSWGARGVLAHHWEIHPEHFMARGTERRLVHAGTNAPDFEVPDPEDFGFRFYQTESLVDEAAAETLFERVEGSDVRLAQYILPFADEPTVAPASGWPPPLSECLALQAEGAGETGRRRDLRLAGSRSLVPETNGEPIVAQVFRAGWRGGAWCLRLPLTLDPGIEGGRGALTLDLVREARAIAEAHGQAPPIVQMDNFLMDSDFVTTDPAMIAACEGPLTVSPDTLEPAALLVENHVRWLRALAEEVGDDGVISGNVLRAGVSQCGIPYLDGITFECAAADDPSRGENWSLEELSWRRALAGPRPIAALVAAIPPRGQRWTPETAAAFVETIWHRCLLFAITPTVKEAWASPD
ncbi:hypothetical protein JXA47_11180, partial [Candidatus Sumerlaeota bacterium]|nr:hypothetical protein [Candidatus Sumerlaeota bacterium]